MRELPFELVTEILARVPVKGLIRFRCVCKSWRSLFQEERFIQQQMSYAPSRIMSCGTTGPVYSFIYEKRKAIAREVDLSIGNQGLVQESGVAIIGHCDGLFCLHFVDRSLAIWNPALRELRKIPAITTRRLHTEICLKGFGYDHSIDDYKIVLATKKDGCLKAQVLTVKSNRSRMIDFPSMPNHNNFWKMGAFAGENIFWQSFTVPQEEILSFSLVSETFSYCSGPKLGIEHYRNLIVSSGILYVVATARVGDYGKDFVLWCAQHDKEDKGVIKSWSMKLRFTLDNIGTSIGSCVDRFRPGFVELITDAGLFLTVWTSQGETKLGAYNFEDKTMIISETHLGRLGFQYEYIETLVSPRSLMLLRASS